MRKISRAAAVPAGALACALTLGAAAFAAAPAAALTNPSPAAFLLKHARPGTPLRVAGGERPTASALTQAITNLQSANWAGYAASYSTRTFRWVSANFKVPAVSCTGVTAANGTISGHWVGLDGFRNTSTTVEQVGVIEGCAPTGSNTFVPAYLPFWEMAPNQAYSPGKVTVHAGDAVRISVYYNKSTHVFTLSFSDVTNGQHFTRTSACPSGSTCKRNSAEAISEPPLVSYDPSTGDAQFAPLADFGSMKFNSVAITTTSGLHGGLTSPYWNTYKITETAGQNSDSTPMNFNATGTGISSGTVLDIPSSLSNKNTFSNTWQPANS
jgi:hypothetical protein